MPVELVVRVQLDSSTSLEGRLSSFGFSGTIAHAAFSARRGVPLRDGETSHGAMSCYRRQQGGQLPLSPRL